mgnify:CR=1 FL=1
MLGYLVKLTVKSSNKCRPGVASLVVITCLECFSQSLISHSLVGKCVKGSLMSL